MTDKAVSGKEIRVLPIPGRALLFDSTQSTRSVFSIPEQGFLIGPENHIIEPVVQWILDGPAERNVLPIFFFGPSGCGKTHLLSGLAESWVKKHRKGSLSKKAACGAVYMTAPDFARHFSDAIETRTTEDFRKRFRNVNLLFLDDLDRIISKPWVLEELQHTLDALETNGGTAVFAANRSPLLLNPISDSFRARLVGGTVLPILAPGELVRKHFIENLASAYQVSLSEPAIQFAAEKLPYTFPRLYGIFSQIVFESSTKEESLNLANFKDSIQKLLNESFPTTDVIAKKVAKHFSLKLADLRGKSRDKTIALARSVAVYLAKQKTGKTVKEIADYFGKRDVSTVRYLIGKVDCELATDPVLRRHIAQLSQD